MFFHLHVQLNAAQWSQFQARTFTHNTPLWTGLSVIIYDLVTPYKFANDFGRMVLNEINFKLKNRYTFINHIFTRPKLIWNHPQYIQLLCLFARVISIEITMQLEMHGH